MDDCLFCKIIKGDIPSTKVYEDDNVFAFLDISPINAGHTLVVPKRHYANIYDTPEEVLGNMMGVIKKLSSTIKEVLRTDGVNVYMNNEKGAGQVVFHTHIHVIPRFNGDGRDLWHGRPELADSNEEVAKKIRNAL